MLTDSQAVAIDFVVFRLEHAVDGVILFEGNHGHRALLGISWNGPMLRRLDQVDVLGEQGGK